MSAEDKAEAETESNIASTSLEGLGEVLTSIGETAKAFASPKAVSKLSESEPPEDPSSKVSKVSASTGISKTV